MGGGQVQDEAVDFAVLDDGGAPGGNSLGIKGAAGGGKGDGGIVIEGELRGEELFPQLILPGGESLFYGLALGAGQEGAEDISQAEGREDYGVVAALNGDI